MKRKPRIAALAAACALALSACNSASDVIRKYNRSQATGYDTSTVKKDSKIAAMVPEAIKADGVLSVGTNPYYAPAEFKQGERYIGYEIDVMRAVAARMGLKLDIREAEFDSILPGIPERYEVGASAFTITSERTANFNMIQYFHVGTSWAVAAGNPTEFNPKDICGRTIGVQTGTIQDEEVVERAKACQKAADIQRYNSQEETTLALSGGKVEAMVADSSVIDYAISKTKGSLETAGDVTGMAPQGIVVAKGDQASTAAVQAALQSLIDDGTMEKIFKAWGIKGNVSPKAIVNPEV